MWEHVCIQVVAWNGVQHAFIQLHLTPVKVMRIILQCLPAPLHWKYLNVLVTSLLNQTVGGPSRPQFDVAVGHFNATQKQRL
jgi:hypothetical protein